jgi:hypothetical protein
VLAPGQSHPPGSLFRGTLDEGGAEDLLGLDFYQTQVRHVNPQRDAKAAGSTGRTGL